MLYILYLYLIFDQTWYIVMTMHGRRSILKTHARQDMIRMIASGYGSFGNAAVLRSTDGSLRRRQTFVNLRCRVYIATHRLLLHTPAFRVLYISILIKCSKTWCSLDGVFLSYSVPWQQLRNVMLKLDYNTNYFNCANN